MLKNNSNTSSSSHQSPTHVFSGKQTPYFIANTPPHCHPQYLNHLFLKLLLHSFGIKFSVFISKFHLILHQCYVIPPPPLTPKLLKRLETSYGITGTPLAWIRSYITNRKQSVKLVCPNQQTYTLPVEYLKGPYPLCTKQQECYDQAYYRPQTITAT